MKAINCYNPAMATPLNPSAHAICEFATTEWSVVLRARNCLDDATNLALATLCKRYWFPLYAYIRRHVSDVNEAQDLTQGFFAQLLETNLIGRAEPERGRFRSFLLVSCKNFLANERDRSRAQKRGGAVKRLSLDFDSGESRVSLEPSHELTPDRLFERKWALVLLDVTIDRLRAEYVARDQLSQFELLKQGLTGDRSRSGYVATAERLGATEAAARQSGHRLRKRFRELLREEVAKTVADPSQINDEIQRLFKSLER